jgi:hypothetical protein
MICLFLIVATIAVYWQVANHDFLNYDDREYVTGNYHVQAGLTWEGIIWAFTTFHATNWHPLAWLSHMLDCQIYGLNAGGHHRIDLQVGSIRAGHHFDAPDQEIRHAYVMFVSSWTRFSTTAIYSKSNG